MTAYNDDIMLSAALRGFVLEPCEAPTQSEDWNDQALVEGDVVSRWTSKGITWYRIVPGAADTGRATRNYHPTSGGGDWKLGHRD